MENAFPGLRRNYYLGSVRELSSIDALWRPKSALYRMFRDACSPAQKKVFLNNLELGLGIGRFFEDLDVVRRRLLECSEHPAITPTLKGTFAQQRAMLGPSGIQALYLYIDGPCRNCCIFCTTKTNAFSPLSALKKKIADRHNIAGDVLCIVGNEPLAHPQIISVVRAARRNGFRRIEVMTSGEYLEKRATTKKLKKAGVTSFSIPLHASTAPLHDRIVGRKGSFIGTLRGIGNALQEGMQVFIHANLLRQNIANIPALERMVVGKMQLPFVVFPIRRKTTTFPFNRLAPRYGQMIKKLKGTVSLMGFPFCVAKKIQKDYILDGGLISDAMKLYFLGQLFEKAPQCRRCFYGKRCPGFIKESLAGGNDDIKPIKR